MQFLRVWLLDISNLYFPGELKPTHWKLTVSPWCSLPFLSTSFNSPGIFLEFGFPNLSPLFRLNFLFPPEGLTGNLQRFF